MVCLDSYLESSIMPFGRLKIPADFLKNYALDTPGPENNALHDPVVYLGREIPICDSAHRVLPAPDHWYQSVAGSSFWDCTSYRLLEFESSSGRAIYF